jgi:uroporphyrinogen decarboxylase
MNSRERVMGTVNRTGYDRIPIKHEGTPEVNHMIMQYFGLRNMEQLLRVVGDDFRYVEPIYIGPTLRTFPDGSIEGYWGERYKYAEFEGGKYLESCYQPFAGIDSVDKLDRSHFPTADWFDYSTIKEQAKSIRREFAVCCGTAGDTDFINGIGRARGPEQVLMDLIDENPVYLEIMNARFNFYYEMHRRILEAGDGLIDFVHIGEDFGTQKGPLISIDIFEKLFAPKYKKHFNMVHSYGAMVMEHICGNAVMFLPRLIELGLDVYDVVQPTSPEADIAVLKERFGDKLIFCGSMCVQNRVSVGQRQGCRKGS